VITRHESPGRREGVRARVTRAGAGALLLLAVATAPGRARDVPPAPATYVLDEGGWLSSAQEARLSADLLGYERETSNQIVVAVFRSLDGEDLADFSQRVAEAWGVGRREKDNGILLAVYVAERQIDIEVGYGLEGVVTDAVANGIRTGILVPAFRARRFADGIFQAVDALKAAARGEYEGTGRALSDTDRRRTSPLVPFLVFLALVILLHRARGGGGLILGPPGWGPSGRGYRSFDRGWGSPGGGGGFGGSGGGGGFRGGGGSFGGGGARGGW
jgi:uncharacterized protein